MTEEWSSDELAGIDSLTPNVARMYDYYLGGGANFKADRELAQKVLQILPEGRAAAVENRHFLRRAVRFAAEQGIRQFLDLGAGIPNVNPTHEVARAVHPDAKVVYVDSETVAAIHARRKLEGDENSLVVQAELQDVDAVLQQSAALLDFTEPVAVMMVAILHFVPEEDDPRGIVNRYAETSAPGSYLIASHGTADGDLGNRLHDVVGEYKERANYNVHLRSKDEFAAILASYELVEPGITWARAWRPDEQTTDSDEAVAIYAAVGAKG